MDGHRWRVVPDSVVLRCGLAPGTALERPLLRRLRRELRHAEALAIAARTVSRRDVSAERLRERLAARGVRSGEAAAAVATLATAGVVDDARTALRRAERLAERGWGDEAVAARLTGEGFGAEDVRLAVQALAPERDRAAALAAAAGDARAAWKLLVRRGFALETTEAAVGVLDGSR